MEKKDIIAVLEEIAELLEIQGENPFKCRAYHNAARALESISEDPAMLAKSGKLTEIQGIGAGLAEKIEEMVTQGKSSYLDQLRTSIPPGVLELLRIPGLGPRKAKILFDKLEIHSIGELEYACKENRLLDLKGFGEKTQINIQKGIELLKRTAGRFLFDFAWREAAWLRSWIAEDKNTLQCEIAGSLRRYKETIGDVDILASIRGNPGPIIKKFVSRPEVADVLAQGETKTSVRLKSGLQVDLRIVEDKEFPYALLYFTGSKEHNTELRGIAKDKGLKLNEYGLFRGEKNIPCKNEEEIYRALGLHFIPPEAREGTGEIEFAKKQAFPRLIEVQDLKGIFHVHSLYSDGKATVLEMAQEAERLGFEYMGLSDHSQSAFYANGLKEADLARQAKEVAETNRKLKKLKVLQGTESDILADGSLDYPDKTLGKLEFVIASIHSRFKMDREQMTGRMVKAISNPRTNFLGHISGRLLLGREAYLFDLDPVLEAAARRGVAIEINANPHRFDLDWRHLRRAKEAGVKFSINPDAHSVAGLSDTFFGVGIARKGWLSREDVINTRPLEGVREFLKK